MVKYFQWYKLDLSEFPLSFIMIIKNNSTLFTSAEKIKYSARRGMLELDIMLAPYLDNKYMQEDLKEKKLFIQFLTSEDSDLFDWLFKGVEAPDEFQLLIKKICVAKKEYNQKYLK